MPLISNNNLADELGLTAGEVSVLAKKMPKTKIGLMSVSAENFIVDRDKFMEELAEIHKERMNSYSKKKVAGERAARKRWANHNKAKAKAGK